MRFLVIESRPALGGSTKTPPNLYSTPFKEVYVFFSSIFLANFSESQGIIDTFLTLLIEIL